MEFAHVPAWRRLGLKLKSEEHGVVNGDNAHLLHSKKKRKLSLSQKRKSVSFTPDTKIQDGGKDLTAINEAEFIEKCLRKAGFDLNGNRIGIDLIPSVEDSTKPPQRPEKAKEQKNSPSGSQIDTSSSEHISPHVHYLIDFYRSPSTWKFNKAKQNWLLKNLLDLDKIPDKYQTALLKYVSTIENQMAQQRLNDAMQAHIDADAVRKNAGPAPSAAAMDKVNTVQQRRQAYEAVVGAHRKRAHSEAIEREEQLLLVSPEWRMRLLKRKRAQELVWAVAGPLAATQSELPDRLAHWAAIGQAAQSLRPGHVTKRARQRYRKRRTGVPDDDTSSSATDSDSLSGAESDAAQPPPTASPAANGVASSPTTTTAAATMSKADADLESGSESEDTEESGSSTSEDSDAILN